MVLSVLAVDDALVFYKAGPVRVPLRAVIAAVFISPVVVLGDQMFVQSATAKALV